MGVVKTRAKPGNFSNPISWFTSTPTKKITSFSSSILFHSLLFTLPITHSYKTRLKSHTYPIFSLSHFKNMISTFISENSHFYHVFHPKNHEIFLNFSPTFHLIHSYSQSPTHKNLQNPNNFHPLFMPKIDIKTSLFYHSTHLSLYL